MFGKLGVLNIFQLNDGEGSGNPLQFLPGESQGRRSLVGCRLWGRTESDTTSDSAAAAAAAQSTNKPVKGILYYYHSAFDLSHFFLDFS